jgi:hypothetical protein
MNDLDHTMGLFGSNNLQHYSFVDMMEVDDELDNSMNLLKCSPYYNENLQQQAFSEGNQTLNILSLNCQSLNAKFDMLQIFIENMNSCDLVVDVFCLQETWISKNDDVSHLSIENYELISKGKQCSTHGGVAIYLHKKHKFHSIELFDSESWDGQFIEIGLSTSVINTNKKLVLGNIYRPPRTNVSDIDNFSRELTRIFDCLQRYSNVLITGDFNINLLNYKEKQHVSHYVDSIIANSYIPKITYPTRLTQQHGTLIDNFFMKMSPELLHTKAGILLNQISDHLPYFVRYPITQPKNQTQEIQVHPNELNASEGLRHFLANSNILETLDESEDADPCSNYNILKSKLKEGIERYFSAKTVRYNKYKHKKSPWISNGIMKSIKYRDRLYIELKKCPIGDRHYNTKKCNLQTYGKILRQCIRVAKRNYYFHCFETCKSSMKDTWRNVNALLNRTSRKKDFPKQFQINDEYVSDPGLIANAFNKFFVEIGPSLADDIAAIEGKNFKDYLDLPANSSFQFAKITPLDVIKTIDSLKPKSSRGVDMISNRILKATKHELASSLTLIINQCLEKGVFPDPLKFAKVVPIFKKGQDSLFTNYRPVSILPSISKIFEKIMHKQMYSYFDDNRLFYQSQYGFRAKHSTELAVSELLDKVINDLDKGETPISIFLDMSKAFDTINHDILLYKLRYYGFNDTAIKLLQSYLKNRYQYVDLNGTCSEKLIITTGVPQGSILGPLLFIIYMNDIHKLDSCLKPILYADDTTLSATLNQFQSEEREIQSHINDELHKFYEWMQLNQLSLNCSKSTAMLFHMPNRRIQYPRIEINGCLINFVKEFNFLGIVLTENLKWKAHVDYISKKISKTVGILNRLKRSIPRYVLMNIYNALVVPHLNYGIILWGNDQSRLYKLQKKAMRAILNSKYNAHTSIIFKQLRILKLKNLYEQHCLNFCYKLEKKELPDYFLNENLFVKRTSIHDYFNRGQNMLFVPRVRREFAKQAIRYKITLIFNEMDETYKEKIYTHSFQGFKNYIKNKMIDSYDTECDLLNCYVCNQNVQG